ncbi:acetyl-CoA synthetase-like protein [Aspergillus heteromorphus CBS 117.55]|uniref:Acetyl-CoA synthetase-like protein n=1 Tax=Aspergillus heteromorphus CBS 117.55 TaxID=1448321 RepID=A0A317VU24_9EURO|nr:acetyl-CoA synthetase-like protein [Aspergillus heteromorphus CBS 117.55]PWY75370.1 acetyl-CoA synthetase-like protein [Aspergillus heteromorphus CBS 117.55]
METGGGRQVLIAGAGQGYVAKTAQVTTPKNDGENDVILSKGELDAGQHTYISITETPPSPASSADAFLEEIADLCNCLPQDIEDVYPCTALQEGMMAMTTKSPMSYTVVHEYRVPPSIKPFQLQEAWNRTAHANPALRTRIVLTQTQGCVQAVLRGNVAWREISAEDDDILSDDMQSLAWRMGGQLAYLTLNLPRHVLQVCLHHSICDAWSIGPLLRQVEAAYRGESLMFRPFRPLVEYIEATREQATAFWKAELQDAHLASMSSYPPLPSPEYTSQPSKSLFHTFRIEAGTTAGFPVNTKMRLAWAVLQSFYTGTDDVLFGAINVGRSVPVPGVEEMFGPALTSVPVRIRLSSQHTIAEALQMVQHQWATSMEFEHIGLQKLLHMGPGPEAACRFQTLMSVEPRNGHQLPEFFTPHKSIQKTQELYPLVLRCKPSDTTIEVEALVDPGVVSPLQAERILGQLGRVYEQIEKEPSTIIGEIDPVSQEDRAELLLRNISVDHSTAACVHDLISRRAQVQPTAPAISAWDGELSYRELDDLSSIVASRLSGFNIRPGMFVPLLVEKSKWVPVAMIAVLKAGGAFVLLEKSYPVPRLQQMCQALSATLVVSSEAHLDLAAQLGVPSTLVVDGQVDDQSELIALPPIISPEDPMYVTFTSGSTGAPKGVINHHAGYASSALAHGEPYHFTPQSRVLQFASPAFDSCIIEHLSTLIMGGCVCIPTAPDCLSNLVGAIQEFNVNVACLTPSVTRILTPGSVPSLQVLAFVGEAVLASDIARWKPYVDVRNAYGPAECSAVFSVQPQLQENDPTNIGFPTGCIGWVVHPKDHSRLMPLGCPGELIIEGPTVGYGYISNPEQTDLVFIQAPGWRQGFPSSSAGHMYKTGDLVECKEDGSFRYLGRKDTQVKLHGQRLELGEVEHHVCQLFPGAQQVVVEMLRSSPDQVQTDHRPESILAAFVRQGSSESSNETREKNASSNSCLFLPSALDFRVACTTAETRLAEVLPPFMVPAVFLPIASVPLTPSGKTNRRQLREEACMLSWEKVQGYRILAEQPQRPSNECEDRLRQIWAECLNRPVEEISTSTSFFRLGGDSVSAMQAANSCRMAGWSVTVGDMFRYPTITKLAERMQELGRPQHLSPSLQEDPTNKLFRLSPVQKMLFDYDPKGNNRFTQQFLLRVTRSISASTLQGAIQAIVSRHSMLRARFMRDKSGQWAQMVSSDTGGSVKLSEYFLPSLHDEEGLRRILDASQACLDIVQGPLAAVDLITTERGSQYLSIMAHHLVIDYVSWRVILQDLEDILATGVPLQPPSIPFQQWCQLQQTYAEESLDPKTALSSNIPTAQVDYWGLGNAQNTWADVVHESIKVSQDATQALLGLANDAFHTRPVELIQAAILYAFVQIFDDRQAPAIFNEGHGREPWDATIDISRTVGWFTTMAPLFVDAHKGQGITELLQLIKSGRRSMPSNGWAYFASRYLHPQGPSHCEGHAPIEILFNYSGLFQQLERQDAILQLAVSADHDILPIPLDLPRFALIDVSATVTDGSFHLSFAYHRHMHHGDRIMQWIQNCRSTLEGLPRQLQDKCQFTVLDFPLLALDNDEHLQVLLQDIVSLTGAGLSDIEDIYPCSPVQLGMWLGQVKTLGKYWSHIRWSVEPIDSQLSVHIEDVQRAWQQVVDRHPILRTIFVDEHTKHGHPVQAVLESLRADVQIVTTQDMGMEDNISRQQYLTGKGLPLHQLTLAVGPGGSIVCQLFIHHMLMDGASRHIILDEFHQAYDGILSSKSTAPYSAYIAYIQQHSGQPEKYWTEYLNGVSPCLFPALAATQLEETHMTPHMVLFEFQDDGKIRSFCHDQGITISSLLQVAWGLVLRSYIDSDSVVFGYLSAGRNIPLKDVSDIVGPLISLLACRLTLNNDADLLSTVLQNQTAYANSIDNQHGSMSEVVHSLGLSGQPLFNTAMSIQHNVPDQVHGGASAVAVRKDGGNDSTDYDITVNITMDSVSIEGDLTYTNIISDTQAELLADTLQHVVMQLISRTASRVGDLDLLSDKNKDQIFQWNRSLPDPVMRCIHRSIQDYSLLHPKDLAVDAWDNSLTYEELDVISSSWAQHLAHHGVGPEMFVPVYCDRSSSVVVAVLAILKAGGAFVLLDHSHPKERLQDMLQRDLSCPIIITSAEHAEAASTIAPRLILIEDMSEQRLPGVQPLVEPSPLNAAYAVFTSGSTGRPKGCVIEHKSLHSAAEAQRKAFRIHAKSRVLHFASYAFDACIIEIFTTLLAGGCICIPPDNERHNLQDNIPKFRINWSLLVTSVARTLNPKGVSPLETLVLGGEKMTDHDVRRWSPYVQLMNAYGPSECSMVALSQAGSHVLSTDPANIGIPVGGGVWVMNPANPNQLVPVGAIGELLVDGPIVGRGYVNRPENMTASFISYPDWMNGIRSPGKNKLYRTGDLVRQLPDGSIRYIARRDRQVKLRGQRIELAEIEHHVQRCFPQCTDVFVDTVIPEALQTVYLVATIALPTHQDESNTFEKAVAQAKARLIAEVPVFLIPNAFIPLHDIPRLVNGKVDRRKVYQHASDALLQPIGEPSASQIEWGPDSLQPEERLMQDLWASVLKRPNITIGPDDNFFLLGGDSLAAMRLASAAAAQGLRLAVPQVFLHPRMRDLACTISRDKKMPASQIALTKEVETPAPFSLLLQEKKDGILQDAIDQCNISLLQIQDIYPCTPWQTGLAFSTAASYMKQHRLRLSQDVQPNKLRTAWETVAASDSILRTRLVDTGDTGCMQVVARYEGLNWTSTKTNPPLVLIESPCFGKPLVHFEIYSPADNRPVDLVITMHPALFDPHSFSLLLAKAQSVYDGLPTIGPDQSASLVKHIQSQKEAALSFWRTQLSDVETDPFPSAHPQPLADVSSMQIQIQSTVSIPSPTDGVDRATAITLAWGLVQSQYQCRDDVVFGIMSDRFKASISSAEALTLPTTAIVPFQMSVGASSSVSQAMANIGQRLADLGQFEQLALPEIAALSSGAKIACSFRTLLAIEGSHIKEEIDPKFARYRGTDDFVHPYPLQIVVGLEPNQLVIKAAFDVSVISEWQMQHLLDQFSHMLQQVHSQNESLVGDILTVNPGDIQEMEAWNSNVPSSSSETVADLIYRNCLERPFAPAVCAWDGDFSYEELEFEANHLANILVAYGIRPESVVAIYSERSRWVAVAILAVLKTRAAFVLLDPSHPLARLQTICSDVEASVVISNTSSKTNAMNLAPNVVCVDVPVNALDLQPAKYGAIPGDPHNALYIVFTSGSTGKPKGVIIENGSFVTMAKSFIAKTGLGPHSRLLQMSGFAFDVSIFEYLFTLLTGACVCIPSEAERMDAVGESVKSLQATHVVMTPTRLRALTPADLRPMHTVMLIGETLRASDIEQWTKHMRVINLYGPTECTVLFTVQHMVESSRPANIGRPIAGSAWIADHRDPHRPVPIGAVGELLLQGPLVGRGYKNNPEKTAAAFIPCPPWIQSLGRKGNPSNLAVYRTGDLVRYEADGTFHFLGRRDFQVKLRGQRVELGEVEQQVQQTFPGGLRDALALVITPAAAVKSQCLVVFIVPEDAAQAPRQLPSLIPPLAVMGSSKLSKNIGVAKQRLGNILPSHMVPTAFVPLEYLPKTSSSKTDRRQLQEAIAAITWQQLEAFIPTVFEDSVIDACPQQTDSALVSAADANVEAIYPCTPAQRGEVFCRLDINVIIDATSESLLERDLCRAYDSCLSRGSHIDAYPGYLEFVRQQPMKPAQDFWKSYLQGYKPSHLPRSRSNLGKEFANRQETLEATLDNCGSKIESFCHESDWTPANLLHMAWALALKAFTGSDDICFGTLSSGRTVPVPHMDEAVGQFANMSVCRIRFTPDSTLDDAALDLLAQYYNVLTYQSFPLVAIARSVGLMMQDLAPTAVNIQYEPPHAPDNQYSLRMHNITGKDPVNIDITLFIALQRDGHMKVLLNYFPSRVATILMTQIFDYFQLAISKIIESPQARMKEIELFSDRDQRRLCQWNPPCAEGPPVCLHEVIESRAKEHPQHLAIVGWDGQLTYEELDRAATEVAVYLRERAVIEGNLIPICFEKSKWAIVTILAIMKAGGTIIPLDPGVPLVRLQEITSLINARVVVSSMAQTYLCDSLAENVIVVDNRCLVDYLDNTGGSVLPSTSPDQAAYILFTSGTTGTPKGVIVSHRSYANSASGQISAFELTAASRVLQMSSYAFDSAMLEILTTLIAGATVCVISESELNQMMVTGICPFPVSHAFLTPSLASGLDATQSSWVETMVLVGEPMTDSHIEQWSTACRLVNGYGPTECAVCSTVSQDLVPGDDPRNIGWGVAINCWVVDQHDSNKLVPVGAIGELVLQGPSVGQGYLGQPERTAEVFIPPPQWLQTFHPGQPATERLYKTGDLVRYEISDGSLRFERRKDRQIQVNGQRVELQEVEYHIRQFFPRAKEVVVEEVRGSNQEVKDSWTTTSATSFVPRLAACIWCDGDGEDRNSRKASVDAERPLLGRPSPDFHAQGAAALNQLRKRLPGYMIPDICVPLTRIPRSTSGKTDRNKLREHLRAVPSHEWRELAEVQRRKQPVEGEKANKFHGILAGLLGIPAEKVGADDSFLHLGGDSILAMRIAARARMEGLEIHSGDILRHPTIREWADLARTIGGPVSQPSSHAPYSLVTDTERREVLETYLDQDGALTRNDVIDVLPTVEFQAYNIENPTVVHIAHIFNGPLDLARLGRACTQVVSQHSILRSAFVTLAGQIYQVILRSIQSEVRHLECEDAKSWISQMHGSKPEQQHLDQPFIEFTVVSSRTQDEWAFMIHMSHGQCDGSSLPVLWQSLADAYNGHGSPNSTEFKDVVYHRLAEDHTQAFAFWRAYLAGASSPVIDFARDCCSSQNFEQTSVSRQLGQQTLPAGVTMATLVHGTLAFILAQYSDRPDAILTQVVHGRGGSLPGMDQVIGPCANHLPMRVRIDVQWSVAELLHHVQAQRLEIAPYDYMAFGEIAAKCTNWPAHTTFGCVVNHQTVASTSGVELDGVRTVSNTCWTTGKKALAPGQMVLTSIERESGLEISLAAAPDVMDAPTAELVAQDLSDAIRLFVANPDRRLVDLADEGFVLISKSSCGSPAAPGTPPN